MKVLFFALKSRLLKNGEAPIILRVTIDGQSEDARIQRSVPLKMWVKVRAKINKIDNKTLSIAEVPFGKTVPGVCDSIVKASEKGKIKIRKVEEIR